MTRDEVIRMARDCEAMYGLDEQIIFQHAEDLFTFAALVAAHEREQCAKVCEKLGMATNGIYERNHECAAAIRERTK